MVIDNNNNNDDNNNNTHFLYSADHFLKSPYVLRYLKQ